MAYGKDPANMGKGGSFRQRAQSYQNQKEQSRSRGGGGGGGVYWATQFKPSTVDVETIRVLEGHFQVPQVVGQGKEAKLETVELPFLPYAEHYDGREGKSTICSAGPFAGSKERAQPCHGCSIFWDGMEKDATGKRKQGRMSRREMYVFSILDYGVYHNVEQVNFNDGSIRINEQTQKPWMHWIQCEGQGCTACRSNKETRRGSARHWALGWGHYSTLLDADKQIGKSCSNCRGINTVVCIAWICGGCGDAIVDMSTTMLKAKDIDELVSNEVTCKCGHKAMAQEIVECRQCTASGGAAKRATIFDVDMNVKRVEASDGGNQTTLSISNWSQPGPIDPLFKDFAKGLDLSKIYKPTSLDVQRDLFKFSPVQRTPVTSTEAARPYQQPQMQPNIYGGLPTAAQVIPGPISVGYQQPPPVPASSTAATFSGGFNLPAPPPSEPSKQ